MSDFLSDGYSLNDYVSDGQLFYKPTDKIRFEGALSALCDSRRHVMIVTDDTKLAERYYRYFITRIAIRHDIVLDTRAPTGADDVLNRFNKILSNASIESARREEANEVTHVMAMADTSNMSSNEWVVLGRLLKNFPGANIRMLAFVSEDQLDVIDQVLGKLDGQVYRWILTSPTAEYLEALLDIGEQFNYQAETRAMALALGYQSKRFLTHGEDEEDPLHVLDEIDRHLSDIDRSAAMPSVNDDNEKTTRSTNSQSNDDFDSDLKALLGAVRNLSTEESSDTTDKIQTLTQTTTQPKERAAKNVDQHPLPPRRLIWATAIAGISLIALAIFAPWESGQVESEMVNATSSSRVFIDDPTARASSNKPDAEKPTANKPTAASDLAATLIGSTASDNNATNSVSEPKSLADGYDFKAQPTDSLDSKLGSDERDAENQLIATAEPERANEAATIESQQVAAPESDFATQLSEAETLIAGTSVSDFTTEAPMLEKQLGEASKSEVADQERAVETGPTANPEFELAVAEPRGETLPAAEPEPEPEPELTTNVLDIETQSIVTPESEPTAEELAVNTLSALTSGSELTREELEVETQPVSEAPRDRIAKAEPTSFFIQLGVYANQTQAQALVDDLAASEPVFFLPLQKGSRVLQTVMSGPYPDRESAELAAGTRFSDSDTWVRSVNAIRNELIE